MRKVSRLSNLLLLFASLLIFLLISECALRLLGGFKVIEEVELDDSRQSRYHLLLQRLRRMGEKGGESESPYMLIHPYFGYTNVPGTVSVHGIPVNNMGFATPVDFPYRKKSDKEFVIAVFGGSVAEILTVMSSATLGDTLKTSPSFADREIIIINCATGAYKQPQQLLIITFLISQGMELDCVVNVDGFNEVAIAGINRKKGTNIYYPAAFYWNEMIKYLTSGTEGLLNNPRYIELVYLRSQCLKKQKNLLSSFLESPFRHLSIARFVFTRLLGRLERNQDSLEAELKDISRRESSLWIKKMEAGPRQDFALELAAEAWARSSILMDQVCSASGIIYIHVLQPNQYDPRGKQLTPTEHEVAFNPKSPFYNGGRWGYPLLREAAVDIKATGTDLIDLSLIFNDVEGDIYIDDCCHFNQRGNDLIMEEIGRTIIEIEAR